MRPAFDAHGPALQGELAGAVVAQVAQAVGGWAQDLCGVADTDVTGGQLREIAQAAPPGPSSIGTRTPSRRAASMASG